MRKLLFLLLALNLSSPVFATTVTDSIAVSSDGYKGVLAVADYRWLTTSGKTPYRWVQAGYNSGHYTANFLFDLSGAHAIPANATITSAVMRVFNTTVSASSLTYIFKIAAFDSSSAPAITDSTKFNQQNAKLTTAQVDWDRTGVKDSTFYNTADLSSVIQELVTDNSGINSTIQLFVANDGDTASRSYRLISVDETAIPTNRKATLLLTYTIPDEVTEDEGAKGRLRGDVSGGRRW